jgi:uncharacterized damage-inducible protein DinB
MTMFDRAMIDAYADGAGRVREAIVGLSADELNAFPVPGTWSIQQIVLHLMDSDLIASDRMKRVVAEENPAIIGYDETAFANRLRYDKLDPHVAADIFQKNRQMTAVILRDLPDEAFDRIGTHNEAGPLTLAALVETYVNHLAHHLKFLDQKRKLLSKPR